ncbi:8255_t:CDS:2 [Diversispora eburnea]|uniref:8255_t:CDS:1 n=1 Tax=Diversispora eburnea TaxID=1213867 RepID=A0A9N9B6X5_9GLOM|nr:8255_t:CDS:2 [Diversispora eburnea]
MDKEEIKNVIDELSMEWRGNTYNLLSSELCNRLVGKPAPKKNIIGLLIRYD